MISVLIAIVVVLGLGIAATETAHTKKEKRRAFVFGVFLGMWLMAFVIVNTLLEK